ncbi:transcription elongation factor Elf1 [Phyllobacterium ifriqiyense]
MERLDHKLDCKKCGTIYLDIPDDVNGTTVIKCSTCGQFLGFWGELSRDFDRQGGQDGVFELRDGQIERKA